MARTVTPTPDEQAGKSAFKALAIASLGNIERLIARYGDRSCAPSAFTEFEGGFGGLSHTKQQDGVATELVVTIIGDEAQRSHALAVERLQHDVINGRQGTVVGQLIEGDVTKRVGDAQQVSGGNDVRLSSDGHLDVTGGGGLQLDVINRDACQNSPPHRSESAACTIATSGAPSPGKSGGHA